MHQLQQGGPICSVQIAEANYAKAQDSARYAEPPFLRIPSPHPHLSQYLHLGLRPRPKLSQRLNRSLLRCLHPSLHLSRSLNRSLHPSQPRYTSISLSPRLIRRRLSNRRPCLKNLRR